MENDHLPLYSRKQEIVLAVLPYFTAPLSALASGVLVYSIAKDYKKKLPHMYHRLLFALSCTDLISSLGMSLLSGWARFDHILGSVGSIATCELQGFLMQFTVCTAMYNASVCLYFFFVLCRQYTPEMFRNAKIEWWMHAVSLVYPVSIGFWALAKDTFNPSETLPAFCYYSDYSRRCSSADVECERGTSSEKLQLAGGAVPVACAWALIILCMIVINFTVRSKEKVLNERNVPKEVIEKTKQIEEQAVWYNLVFVGTFGPAGFRNILALSGFEVSAEHRTMFFWCAVAIELLMPTQGVWNLVIYARPRYRKLRQANPYSSRIFSLFQAIFRSELEIKEAEKTPTKSLEALDCSIEMIPEDEAVEDWAFADENFDEVLDVNKYPMPEVAMDNMLDSIYFPGMNR